jgi:hypothetical protein
MAAMRGVTTMTPTPKDTRKLIPWAPTGEYLMGTSILPLVRLKKLKFFLIIGKGFCKRTLKRQHKGSLREYYSLREFQGVILTPSMILPPQL